MKNTDHAGNSREDYRQISIESRLKHVVTIWILMIAMSSIAAVQDLWITEVDPSTGQVEVTNTGSDAVTTTSALPFCHRFSYSSAIPIGTTFAAGESKIFTVSPLNSTDSDLWLYTAGSFGNANLITSGLKWGPASGVGRTAIASTAGKWSGTGSFVEGPPVGMSLQLTGLDPFSADNWSSAEPNFGTFGTATETLDVYVTIENLSPQFGTYLTPMWAAFHNGNFDIYDLDAAASPGLERIAEDGNTAPLANEFASSGAGSVEGTLAENGPIAPGASTTRRFTVDPASRYFSYASMVIPSNDAFIGNADPMRYEIFDAEGTFIGAEIVVLGSSVRDAGTEINDELAANTAFLGQMTPDTGVPENGVASEHAGFTAAGNGGILDEPMFSSADFKQPAYQLARITVSLTPPRRAKLVVTVENLSPENGTYITPLWVGLQDGSFDIYELGSPASPELERIAEDGNTAPLSEAFRQSLSGIVDSTLAGIGPIAPGASTSTTLSIDINSLRSRYFSYASMVIPSNDAFIANGEPMTHEIVDAAGNFLGAEIIVVGSDVRDAGSETNDEVPANTAFLAQAAPNTGGSENGVVMDHSGFMGVGSGGILDNAMFVNADFKQAAYQVARITVSLAPPEIVDIKVIVENLSPANGTFLTPVWVGIQDGTFDLYDLGASAAPALERIAEDGNTEPLSSWFRSSGAGYIDATLAGIGPIGPGASTSTTLSIDLNSAASRYLSYTSMVIPSNDAFVANGNPTAHEIVDADGNFIGAEFVVSGLAVRDAGTEINDEIPANTAFLAQAAPDTGDAEDGTVSEHAGFLTAGSGGILDDAMFSSADFTAENYDVMRVTVRMIEPRPVEVTVTVENLSPENGTFVTPVWVGLHDGTFDIYDLGAPTCPELERIAEDGNTGPFSDLFSNSRTGLIDATLAAVGPIAPGASTTSTLWIDLNSPRNRYFSYASMVIPSNDAFIANAEPMAHEIIDAEGKLIGAQFIVSGSEVRDAGTEVNDEIPTNTAFLAQTAPNTGDDEDGIIAEHAGFKSAGEGGILDDPMFAGADFIAANYEIVRITVALRPLMIESIAAAAEGFTVVWAGGIGPFQVQQRSMIAAGDWENLGEPTSSSSAIVDNNDRQSFFRVVDTWPGN